MSETYEAGPYPGGQIMDMTQNCSFLWHKGNFPGKTKNNKSRWICLKDSQSTSLLQTLMKYVKNSSNCLNSRDQTMDMTQNYSLWPQKGNFPGKTKNNRSTWICLKYNLSTSLSTLMTYVENISSWPDTGGQRWDMSQNYSLWVDKANFPGKTENNKSTRICLKCSLTNSLLSISMTYVKNISNWPDLGCHMMDITRSSLYSIIHFTA